MTWVKKVAAPTAMLIGFGAAVGFAQLPDGGGEAQPPVGQKRVFELRGEPTAEVRPMVQERQPGRGDRAERGDPAVDAWVKVLTDKMTDPHDTIRDSARGALVGVGRAALPALQRLADGDDGAKAVAARKVIGAIEGGGGRGPMGGGPMNPPMGGGRGPGVGGPGGPGIPGGGGPGFGPMPGGPGIPPMGPGNPGGGRGPGAGPMGPGSGQPTPQPGRPE